MSRHWQTTIGLGLTIALLATAAPAVAAGPLDDARAIVKNSIYGYTPTDADKVLVHCEGTNGTSDGCTNLAATTGTIIFSASACDDARDADTCSDFTGTLRVTVNDGGWSDDDVYEFDFTAGVANPFFWWTGGDDLWYSAYPTVTVDAIPLRVHSVGVAADTPVEPSGGHWNFWMYQSS